jgi:hypothetical protein
MSYYFRKKSLTNRLLSGILHHNIFLIEVFTLVPINKTHITTRFTNVLYSIGQLISPDSHTCDSNTHAFFQFKAFPKGLRRAEVNDWVKLQLTLLNPFDNGDVYHFVSLIGIHAWFTKSKFNGVPETALQQSLKDGLHTLTGAVHTYRQKWQNGYLVSCYTISLTEEPNNRVDINTSPRLSWAKKNPLNEELRSPLMWTGLSFFLFLCVCVWTITAHISFMVQEAKLEKQIKLKSDTLGQKLVNESTKRETITTLNTLSEWKNEFHFLPEAYGMVAESLLKNGNFQPNNLRWQNKNFELEFVSEVIDLPNLVASLESSDAFSKVSVRPHNDNNTWILEVRLK